MILTKEVVAGFVGSVLASKFDGAVATPEFHHEGWEMFTSKDRLVALAAPRGHAKTTGMTVSYGLATLLFRERKFMLLVSDTESQAAMFLGYFKEQLQENTALVELFGLKRDDKGIVRFVKETETDIIVEMEDGHKFRVIAKGAEQKLRGLIWSGSRPDIILIDDFENDELVMNKDRREKMRKWFYSALLPCVSSTGIVRVVGTILHMDSLLERLMPKPYDRWSHQEPLKLWSEVKRNGWRSVKYRAHTDDFSHVLWPEKHSEATLREKRAEYTGMGMPDIYSQEYLNVPLDESVAYFKRNDFDHLTDEDKSLKLKYYITADLAISEADRADYSVFVIGGMDEHRRLQVRQVIRERMDGREIVDTLLLLQRIYDPEVVGIEEMQVSKSIGPFLREEMVRQNTYLNLFPLKHGGKDKIARGRSIQARMRAKAVKFDKQADWYPAFEEELTRFPRDTHDDQVDAFAYLGLLLDRMIEAPTVEEQEEEIYADEHPEHAAGTYGGRSQHTGY
jgi:predicted phage terminase large subunit-like protein